MELLKLKPAYKDYIWGGTRLKEAYGKDYDGDVLAESWELSAYPGSASVIEASSKDKEAVGRTLDEYIESVGKRSVLGSACDRFESFPVLIKLIDAARNLSIQVHPSDEYAREHEGQYGKTEMWYIIDAAPEAFIYYGFDKIISRDEFRERIENNTLEKVLFRQPVKKGETYFIPAGTIHAIGAGCLIAEIQQNSNVTYRVYDYGRVGADGKPRELHIEKAVDVTELKPVKDIPDMGKHLGRCPYFTTDKIEIGGKGYLDAVGEASFKHLLFLSGSGEISYYGRGYSYKKGDSFLFTAGSGEYRITGTGEVLITYEE
ncbi:MAG: class I mannose-6-phosphate isomerase [Lachnospiraceae bacterium]|nr:class I mannose-6-phosphate isomerase [Lachnospiraceae bacterium]